MANAKKLPSGAWRVLVYSHTEKIIQDDGSTKNVRRYESFTNDDKKEALFQAAEFVRNKKRKSKPINITLGDAMSKYIAVKSAVLSPSTVKGYIWISKNIYKAIHNYKLSELTNDVIQNEVNKDAALRSAKSVKNAYGFLSAVLDMFYPDFKVRITLPQRAKTELYVPTDDDIKKLMRGVAGTSFEIPVLLAAFGSLRRSEVCALESGDIDGNCVSIRRAMVKDSNHKYVIKPPKTFSGYRTIELPQFVIDKMNGIEGRIVKLTPDYITRRFPEILKELKIPAFRFHDLRHYQASILHALGIPDKYIMERGGWKTDSTLKNIYQHTMADKKKEFTNIANQHFEEMQHEMQHAD